MSTPPSVVKTIERIKCLISSGSHYEAQQMLKTVYHRHRARKQLVESHVLLKEGAMVQLQSNQVTCGIELGQMLIQAFIQDKTSVTEGLPMTLEILACLPLELELAGSSAEEATLEEELRFVSAAGKWAQKLGHTEAVRQIHDAFALHIWKLYGWRRMGRASLHFARGSDADQYAKAVYECSAAAPPNEADLFMARAIMQTLAIASNSVAAKLQLEYAKKLLGSMQRLFATQDTPLIHFTSLLLEALELKSKSLTALLKQRYQKCLERDPMLTVYLTQIQRVFLGIGASSGGMGGLLGNLLKSLTQMDEDEEESDVDDDGDQ